MDLPDDATPKARIIDHVQALHDRIEELEDDLADVRSELERTETDRDFYRRQTERLRKELASEKEMRRTDREGLVEWLDRRVKQQEEAMRPKFISQETKRVMEIEISILRRYREMLVEGEHRVSDPLMQKQI